MKAQMLADGYGATCSATRMQQPADNTQHPTDDAQRPQTTPQALPSPAGLSLPAWAVPPLRFSRHRMARRRVRRFVPRSCRVRAAFVPRLCRVRILRDARTASSAPVPPTRGAAAAVPPMRRRAPGARQVPARGGARALTLPRQPDARAAIGGDRRCFRNSAGADEPLEASRVAGRATAAALAAVKLSPWRPPSWVWWQAPLRARSGPRSRQTLQVQSKPRRRLRSRPWVLLDDRPRLRGGPAQWPARRSGLVSPGPARGRD